MTDNPDWLERLAHGMTESERAAVIALANGPHPFASGPSLPITEEGVAMRSHYGDASQNNGNGTGSTSSLPPYERDKDGEKKDSAASDKAKGAGKSADPILVQRPFTNEEKVFVVEKFAHFWDYPQIEEGFLKRFGRKPDRRHLEAYNGDHRNCRMGKRLRTLFAEARRDYTQEIAKVSVTHQAHRLRLVSKLIDKATASKEYAAAIKGLELAAKEMGQLQSHQTIRHEGTVAHIHGSIEDARAELAMRLNALSESSAMVTVDATPTLPTPTEGDDPSTVATPPPAP